MTFKTQVIAMFHCMLLEKGVPLYGVGWLRLMFRKTFQVLVILKQLLQGTLSKHTSWCQFLFVLEGQGSASQVPEMAQGGIYHEDMYS